MTLDCIERINYVTFVFFFIHISQVLVKNLPQIVCASLQCQILQIIYGYIDKPEDHIEKLFDGAIKQAYLKNTFSNFKTANDLTKNMKLYRQIVNPLNKMSDKIFSKNIKYLFFDRQKVTPYPVSILVIIFFLF